MTGVTNSEGGGASFSRSAVALATSTGFYGRYAGTSHGIGVAVLAGEGTGMERDYDHASARHAGDLRAAEEIGRTAGEKAVRAPESPQRAVAERAGGVSIPTKPAGLLGHFAGAISGAAIARGVSFLKDRMGQAVFARGVAIIDDPHRLRGLRSKPFDGEGVANAAPRPDRQRPAHHLAAGLRQRPAARACRPPAMPRAARAGRPRLPPPISIWKRASFRRRS